MSNCHIYFNKMMNSERKQKLMQSKWSKYALDSNLWAESNAQVIKVRDLKKIKLTESEKRGILSDRMIETHSSFLSTTPENAHYILIKCELRQLNLVDISALKNHRHLQYVNLEHNKLTELSALCKLSNLLYLNASYNKLTSILNFTAPCWYLTYVNLSDNKITEMKSFQHFWSIVRLDLSHNCIEKISKLSNLRYLRYLNLSYNLIETVENLETLNIQELNLEYNCIRKFTAANFDGIFKNLRTLLIGYNRLSSLKFFQAIYCLRLIDLKYNKIADLMEISYLSSSVYQVDLKGNPCTKWPNYKEVVLYCMPNVMFVDDVEVTVAEKVSAEITFNPPTNLLASRGLTKLTLLEQLNVPRINNSIIPYNEINPSLIILCGPSAVKKLSLALSLTEKYPKRIKYCKSHTTREFAAESLETKGYYFVEREEFNEMARNGEFCTIEELVGDSYGFHYNEIAELRMENKMGITQMDLLASIQMKSRYPNSKVILILTKSEELHHQWIEDKFRIFTWIKDSVKNLWALTIGKHQSKKYIESMSSKIDVINDIIEDVIDNMEIPLHSVCVRPHNMGATTTDIILQSKTMLPKLEKTRKELRAEKRRIRFVGVGDYEELFPRNSSINISGASSELKVILDEQMNIIVDDDETIRRRKRAKIIASRTTKEGMMSIAKEESESSEDSLEESSQDHQMIDPKSLMDNYVRSILDSRKKYIDQHLNDPGFYSTVIYTDDFDAAIKSLSHYIHKIYNNYSLGKPRYVPEISHLNTFIIPDKIDEIVNEMRVKKY